MCGIYGELALRRGHPVGLAGNAATDLLAHRGPDERATWSRDGIFLGVRRLSIIDLATGQQPVWNEDQTCCIVYNGELYNFVELRRELEGRGHRFRTRSDTEVLLHAYEEWGLGCLGRFNGMFAFAVWDERERLLFLARDRIGEKPLYVYRDADRLVFASEIKAMLANGAVPRRLNARGLANYLAFGHGVAPETIYERIEKLRPAHYLVAQDGEVRIAEYWDVPNEREPVASREEYAERIRELLEDSVRRRLAADVPVGVLLSGGIDSAAVTAFAARSRRDAVETFTLGFGLGRTYDERADALTVARATGANHHELLADSADLVGTVRTLAYHYDEPFADPAAVPLYLVSRLAREHVKVVLTGDGGDELFGGYRRYAADGIARHYQRLPSVLTNRVVPSVVGRLPGLRRTKRAAATLGIEDAPRRHAGWLVLFDSASRRELLHPDVSAALLDYDAVSGYERRYAASCGRATDRLNRLMYVDLKTWLADDYMEKTDKATMACGLEPRLPLLDHRLVELAFAVPGSYKVRGFSLKRILKDALEGVVPPTVLRKPKHGFAVPLDRWFRRELKSFAFDVLFDDATRRRGYINPSAVTRMWREHMNGARVEADRLWALLNLELWARAYLDGEAV